MTRDIRIKVTETGAKKAERGLDGVDNSTKKLTTSFSGMATAAGVVAVAFAGLSVLKDVVANASEAEAAQAALGAVLKSTGEIAGVTRGIAVDLSNGLQQLTAVSDDAILSTEALLLTFTSISATVFPRAIATVLDMSRAFGTDLKGSAIQLGKALNDPILGISALSRVGVAFTQTQKDLIRSLQESGDVAGAQGIILDELEKEVGGAAEAYAKTLPGAIDAAKLSIADLSELFGKELSPSIKEAAETVGLFSRALQDIGVGATTAYASALTTGVVGLGLFTSTFLKTAGEITKEFDQAGRQVKGMAGGIADFKTKTQRASAAVGTMGAQLKRTFLSTPVLIFAAAAAVAFLTVKIIASRQAAKELRESLLEISKIDPQNIVTIADSLDKISEVSNTRIKATKKLIEELIEKRTEELKGIRDVGDEQSLLFLSQNSRQRTVLGLTNKIILSNSILAQQTADAIQAAKDLKTAQEAGFTVPFGPEPATASQLEVVGQQRKLADGLIQARRDLNIEISEGADIISDELEDMREILGIAQERTTVEQDFLASIDSQNQATDEFLERLRRANELTRGQQVTVDTIAGSIQSVGSAWASATIQGQNAAEAMATAFKAAIASIVSTIIANAAILAIFAAFNPAGATASIAKSGGLLSALFGGLIPAANGFQGQVTQPTLFLAGEAGPEDVRITPQGQRGGGGNNIVINVAGNIVDVEEFTRRDIKPVIDRINQGL